MKTIQRPKLYDHFAPVQGTKIVDFYQGRGTSGISDAVLESGSPAVAETFNTASQINSTPSSKSASFDWINTAVIVLLVVGTVYLVYKVVEEEREEKERGLNL
jgi:hypothetical protein